MWCQLEFQDPTRCSGATFARLVEVLRPLLDVTSIACAHVEGAGENFAVLWQSDRLIVLTPEEFEARARTVVQFDWADFYLLRYSDDVGSLQPTDPPAALLERCAGLVRAVDDEFVVIYVRKEDRDQIARLYPTATEKCGQLDELDFPD